MVPKVTRKLPHPCSGENGMKTQTHNRNPGGQIATHGINNHPCSRGVINIYFITVTIAVLELASSQESQGQVGLGRAS